MTSAKAKYYIGWCDAVWSKNGAFEVQMMEWKATVSTALGFVRFDEQAAIPLSTSW